MPAFDGYQKPFIIALSLHVILLLTLLLSPSSNVVDVRQSGNEQVEIVKAVAVNQQQVEKEMNRIKDEKVQKQKAEEARVKKLQQQAQEAKQQREQELATAQKMKVEQQRLEKELANKQKLAAEALAKQQKEAEALVAEQKALAEKARLEALKKQQEAKDIEQQAAAKALAEKASAQRQSRLQGELAKIKLAIEDQWRVPDIGQQDISTWVSIRLAPDGTVLRADIETSSGIAALDISATTAVEKASPLPVPADPELFNELRSLRIKFPANGSLETG